MGSATSRCTFGAEACKSGPAHETVLWASFPTSDGSCELMTGEDHVRIADLRPKVGTGQGLCAIWQAPGGTLLADSRTGRSRRPSSTESIR